MVKQVSLPLKVNGIGKTTLIKEGVCNAMNRPFAFLLEVNLRHRI